MNVYRLLLSLAIVCLVSHIHAQDADEALSETALEETAMDSEEADLSYLNTKEVSINATFFMKQFLSFTDNIITPVSPYLLTYKSIGKYGSGVRMSIGGDFDQSKNTENNDPDATRTSSAEFDARVGWEKQFKLGERWMAFTGIDLVGGVNTNKLTQSTNGNLQSKSSQNGFDLGAGPTFGVYLKLGKRVWLHTESSVYYHFRQTKNKTVFVSFPGFPGGSNTDIDKTTEHDIEFLVPTSLFISLRF